MSPIGALAALAVGAALLAIGYWAYVISEGAYFGPRAVTWLYDRGAADYDAIKAIDPIDDDRCLVAPLLDRAPEAGRARVLDVATGTGRLPLALLCRSDFDGEVVGLDLSTAMLGLAWSKLGGWAPRLQLVHGDATRLPFDDASFDAVTSLEALEFTPRPLATLGELARVLRPGGVLCVTNRVGWEAPLLPGRAFDRAGFESRVRALGFEDVETRRWQTYYDLVWARRSGRHRGFPADGWPSQARCPRCSGPLAIGAGLRLDCRLCGAEIPWLDGAWDFERAGG